MEKKQRDIALSEELLPVMETISEGMPGGFFLYRAHGAQELIFNNKAMLRIFGCRTQEEFEALTGNSFKGIVHPEDYPRTEASIREQIAGSREGLDYVEYRIVRKDGSVRWVEDYGHFLRSETYGDIFYVFIEDATDRLRARMKELERVNRELRFAYARESQYRKAILHDAEVFFEVDLTTDEFLTPVARTARGSLGAPVKGMETLGYREYINDWAGRIDPDGTGGVRRYFDPDRLIRACETGRLEQSLEFWSTDAAGRKRLYRYMFLLGKNGANGHYIALSITKDVTDQVKKQQLLQTALRRANAANVARQTFLVNISHDLRTPLNSIIGFTELLGDQLHDEEKVRDYLQKMRQSGQELLNLVTEAMELTRAESGRTALTETTCDLRDVLADVKEQLALEIKTKRIHFLADASGVVHPAVIADGIRLAEILCQLLDNAVKYTREGGHVNLSMVELPEALPGYGKYQFVVKDDGIGISEEFQSKLFTPFERENNTTTSGVLGNGLGLAVVKSVVDMMEGTIEVASAPGKGSAFTVTVLLALQEERAPGEKPETQAFDDDYFKGKRVLLVEDNCINMEIAEALLEGCGFVVDTAENGAVAVRMLEEQPSDTYDVVLMDIQMPVMNGYEATRAIRGLKDPARADIPIIAVSANAFAEDMEKSREVGMDGHCPKPINIQHLQELIGRVLMERSLRAESLGTQTE